MKLPAASGWGIIIHSQNSLFKVNINTKFSIFLFVYKCLAWSDSIDHITLVILCQLRPLLHLKIDRAIFLNYKLNFRD